MDYKTDILGENFECKTISLRNDYQGKAVATLIRRMCKKPSKIAVLYIHGFNDYFFQRELAYKFNENDVNFYALDLRRYGRSHLPHQKFNDVRNLKDYNEEILESIRIIRSEGNEKVILMGHSTGGLIATLFAKNNTNKGLLDGVILNSPFFDFNMSSWILEKLIPLGASIGKILPSIKIAGVLSPEYGESLHKDYYGEWEYNLDWKPNTAPPITLGWLRAIRNGHRELRHKFRIDEPVLVLHSTKTITNKFDQQQMHTMDAVLNVADINRIAQHIEGSVEIVAIEGGMHDLILSRKDVREKVYNTMMQWINRI